MLVDLRTISSEEWEKMLSEVNYSSYFQSENWIKSWEKIYPRSKSICFCFTFEDGQKVYLPGLMKKMFKGIISRFDSSVAGTYGSLLSANYIDNKKVEEIIKKCKTINSFYIYFQNAEHMAVNHFSTSENTYIVDLKKVREGSHTYSKSVYTQINKAKKNELSIKEASSLAEWETYYELYLKSCQRWGKPLDSAYPFVLFKNLFEGDSLTRKLWIVKQKNEIIYGVLCFFHKKQAYFWHGAGDDMALNLGTASFLHDFIIHNLAQKGFDTYDLMPNGGNIALADFKLRFHPIEKPVYYIHFKTPVYKIFEKCIHLKNKYFIR